MSQLHRSVKSEGSIDLLPEMCKKETQFKSLCDSYTDPLKYDRKNSCIFGDRQKKNSLMSSALCPPPQVL